MSIETENNHRVKVEGALVTILELRKPWRIDVHASPHAAKLLKLDREWGAWQDHLGEEFRGILVKHFPQIEDALETKLTIRGLWRLVDAGMHKARVQWVHGPCVSERGNGRVWLDIDRVAGVLEQDVITKFIEWEGNRA